MGIANHHPQSGGKYRGIGLLEVSWKLISSIINKRIIKTVKFHESLHGCRQGRGTGTAILEVKLKMSEDEIKGNTSYQVFLDLEKAYDSISRKKNAEILK